MQGAHQRAPACCVASALASRPEAAAPACIGMIQRAWSRPAHVCGVMRRQHKLKWMGWGTYALCVFVYACALVRLCCGWRRAAARSLRLARLALQAHRLMHTVHTAVYRWHIDEYTSTFHLSPPLGLAVEGRIQARTSSNVFTTTPSALAAGSESNRVCSKGC